MGGPESRNPIGTDPTNESKIDEIPLIIDGPKIIFPHNALQTLYDQSGLSSALQNKKSAEFLLDYSRLSTEAELNKRTQAFLQKASLYLRKQGYPVDEESLPKLAELIQDHCWKDWRTTIDHKDKNIIAKYDQEVQRREAVASWHFLVPLIKAVDKALKREEVPSFQQGWAMVFPKYSIWMDKINETYFSKLVMVTDDPEAVLPQIIFSPNYSLPITYIETSGLFINDRPSRSEKPRIGGLDRSVFTLETLKKPIIFGNPYEKPAEVDFSAYWQTFIRVMEAKLRETFVNRSTASEIAHPLELDAINTDQCVSLLTARTEEVYAWVSRCFCGMIFASCKDEKIAEQLRRGNHPVTPENNSLIGSFMDMVARMKTEIKTIPEYHSYRRLIDR